jgi:hypothetical protein
MKQYLIDELRPEDHERLKGYLDDRYAVAGFEGLYWIPIAHDLLDDKQKAHKECHPHYFALELLPDRLACELLVRTSERIRCDCIQYATETQRNWLIQFIDAALEDLAIKV